MEQSRMEQSPVNLNSAAGQTAESANETSVTGYGPDHHRRVLRIELMTCDWSSPDDWNNAARGSTVFIAVVFRFRIRCHWGMAVRW